MKMPIYALCTPLVLGQCGTQGCSLLHQQNVTLLAVTCAFLTCQCLAISLVSPDKASKARFLLQVFCKPLKFVIFCKAVLVLDIDSVPLLLPAPHCSCC